MPEPRSVEEIIEHPDVTLHRHGGDTTARLVEEQHVLIAEIERLHAVAGSLLDVLVEHERRLRRLIERDTEVTS